MIKNVLNFQTEGEYQVWLQDNCDGFFPKNVIAIINSEKSFYCVPPDKEAVKKYTLE